MSVWKSAVVCNDPAVYSKTLQGLGEKYKRVFILFTGEKVAETGKSWCPDCVVAEPALEKALSFSDPNTVLLVCNVKRSDYKGNSSYPYRTDKNIRLKTVPTFGVVRFPAMSVEMTLEEGDILKEDLMQDVLNAKL